MEDTRYEPRWGVMGYDPGFEDGVCLAFAILPWSAQRHLVAATLAVWYFDKEELDVAEIRARCA
jgi:hypothetical protein